jgi:lactoylglutathione lyase
MGTTSRPASSGAAQGSPRTAPRIAHVALWTSDLERAAAFWERHFGAVVGPLYRSARRPGFASRFVALGDGPAIELMTAPWIDAGAGDAMPPPSATPPREDAAEIAERRGWAHVAVSLGSEDAVRALAARMEAAGHLLSPPRLTGDGFFEAVLSDPDGNLVEITS